MGIAALAAPPTGGACWAVYEDGHPVAAYVWSPPPYGAAGAYASGAPGGCLALSRMVAVPKSARRLRHISIPLRRLKDRILDRGRWPVLVTYSDASLGHTGHVYKCSGWHSLRPRKRTIYTSPDGRRVSRYRNGVIRDVGNLVKSTTTLTPWIHRACPPGYEAAWLHAHGWRRIRVPGTWASGNPKYRWIKA